MVKLEIKLQKLKRLKNQRKLQLEEQERDFSTKEESSTLIQWTRERRDQTQVLVKKKYEEECTIVILKFLRESKIKSKKTLI